MKKTLKLLPFAVILPAMIGISTYKDAQAVFAADTIYTRSNLPTTINLNDYTENEVRNYYSALNAKEESERKGENLLKNLKPILSNNQKYYNYDYGQSIWQMYEITDRDWAMSPASEVKNGTYDASTNTISNYVYGKSNSNYNEEANPYLKSYYMDYSQPNQVKAWGNHNQDGYGINREHLWAKSEGFDDDSSGSGARGDPMHLVAANGCVNREHNNNFYGNVNKEDASAYDCKVKFFDSVGHNWVGPSKTHPTSGVKVFEPQDEDKGDIARAIFYMVARYNNLAGDDSTIGGANPNLALTNDLTKWAKTGFTSTPTTCGYMGVLDDLLEWNKNDPVDEYEIHRNNLLQRNFTNNRNPFIDFPEWADVIWGDSTTAADPTRDSMNGLDTTPKNTISNFKVDNVNFSDTGSLVAPTATAIKGEVKFTYSKSQDGNFTETKPIGVGTWYCKATSDSDEEYASDVQILSFQILGEDNTISDFVIKNVMAGNAPSPTAKAKSGGANDVTFTYSTSRDGEFTTTAPTTAGTYYCKATSKEGGKYISCSEIKEFQVQEFFDYVLDGGCFGSIASVSILISTVSLIGVALLILKKRKFVTNK